MTDPITLSDGTCLPMDDNGYLRDWQQWQPAVAEHMAAEDGLVLSAEHWRVLNVLRDYYAEYEISPPVRALIKHMRELAGSESFDSRVLYRLFPEGPAKQACRYAGLPRPVSCI